MKKGKYIFILMTIVTLSACHSTKKIAEKQIDNNVSIPKVASTAEIIKTLQKSEPKFSTANASKMSIDINLKEHEYSVSAACQMITDSAVYLSVMPVLGIELFKLELTPSKFIVIDKLNRRYYEETYDYVKTQFGVTVSFQNIQSLISNRLFLIERSNYSPEDFTWKDNQSKSLTLVSKNEKTEQETVISPELLNRISDLIIKSAAYNSVITINYSDFQQSETILFPNKIFLKAEQNGVKKAAFDFEIQKIRFNEPLTLKPTNLSKYTRGDINSLLRK